MSDAAAVEALRFCINGGIKVGVPIDSAISAYRKMPCNLTLRTVLLAHVPDRAAAQKQFECLHLAPEDHWINEVHPEYTAAEIREDSLAMVTRTIASLTDC